MEVWDTDRGMPSSAVTSVAATPDGYLWAGTFEGLARFDGIRFTVTSHRNSPDFPDDAVTALYTDHAGLLWASTGNGIARYDHGKWHAYPGPGGLPLRFAGRVLEAEGGGIFVVSGNKFYGLSGDRFTTLPVPPRVRYLKVFAVPGEGIWGSADRYFGRYRGGKWEEVDLPPGLDVEGPVGAAPGRTHGVWVLSAGNLRKYQDGSWSLPLPGPPGFTFTVPVNLLEDSLGNVWAGDYRRGVVVFRKDATALRFGHDQGLPNPTIRALFEGPQQNVWAATDGGGLVRFRRRTVAMFDEADGLGHAVVDSVAEDAPGSLLVGTYGGGLQPFNLADMRFNPPIAPAGARLTPTAMVLAVVADHRGTAWAGTYARGVFRIRGGKVEQLAEFARQR